MVMIQFGHGRIVPTVAVLAAVELHWLLWLLLREDVFQDLLRAQHRLRILRPMIIRFFFVSDLRQNMLVLPVLSHLAQVIRLCILPV